MADVNGLSGIGLDFYTEALNSVMNGSTSKTTSISDEGAQSFETIFNSAMNLISETDELAAKAEEAAIDFSLGNTESTHELTIAQQKAYLSLQYTVAVKNGLLDAYKEIMNIQI